MTTISINVRKAARTIDVDTDMLGIDFDAVNAAGQYVVRYGLTQALNDAHASSPAPATDADRDSIMAIVAKKLDAIYNGTIRVHGERASADPVQALVERMARDEVYKAIRAKGKKVKELDAEKVAAVVADHLNANRERLETLAKDIIAKQAAITVDLGDVL